MHAPSPLAPQRPSAPEAIQLGDGAQRVLAVDEVDEGKAAALACERRRQQWLLCEELQLLSEEQWPQASQLRKLKLEGGQDKQQRADYPWS